MTARPASGMPNRSRPHSGRNSPALTSGRPRCLRHHFRPTADGCSRRPVTTPLASGMPTQTLRCTASRFVRSKGTRAGSGQHRFRSTAGGCSRGPMTGLPGCGMPTHSRPTSVQKSLASMPDNRYPRPRSAPTAVELCWAQARGTQTPPKAVVRCRSGKWRNESQ